MPAVFAAECQGCAFKQRIFGRNDYAYRLEEPPDVFLWTQYAWCSSCQEVVHAERLLPSAESEEWIAGSCNAKSRRDGERYRKMIASRESPARCLNCGGVEIIPASGNWTERHIPHPACGANIVMHHAGLVRLSAGTAVYSSEGRFLLTVRGILIPGRGY